MSIQYRLTYNEIANRWIVSKYTNAHQDPVEIKWSFAGVLVHFENKQDALAYIASQSE